MPNYAILITVGALLLIGLLLDDIGRRTRLPRVSLLVLFGIAAGPSGFDILPHGIADWYPIIAAMALVMVAFLLGGQLTRGSVSENGIAILGVSGAAVIVTAILVAAGLWMLGQDPILCLILAGTSTATDPAATQDVINRAKNIGPFSRLLTGIVAIDDAWGLILFSLFLAFAHAIDGQNAGSVLQLAFLEIGGAILIGIFVGFPAAYLTGRLKPGEPLQSEALGVVFLCGGFALAIHASFLLAAMIAGLIIANFARHHTRAFHEIEHIEWPFMVLFFVLAGASLDVSALPAMGVVGIAYLILRTVGRIGGGWIGGRIVGLPRDYQKWIGTALMPQAGVAMGMALIAANSFPSIRDEVLAITIGTTVVFELIGPIMTQWALAAVDQNIAETNIQSSDSK